MPQAYHVKIEQTKFAWDTALPNEVDINEELLAELVTRINNKEYQNVHSILIVKDGNLVFEEYFPGYEWDWDAEQFQGEFTQFEIDTLHPTMSVSKVFTSTLVGIAVENGFIEDLDEKVFSFFPGYTHLSDQQKENITLEDLLTMKSGLQWNGIEIPISTRDPRNDVQQMNLSANPVEYVLSKPLVAEPGSKWYYSNGDVALLGEVIRAASDMRLDQFAEQYLFSPLDITDYHWRTYGATDAIATGGGLELRPRDMAKLGLLYLNGGVWSGERIISSDWVEAAISNHTPVPFDWMADLFGDGFGYYWWLPSFQTGSTIYDSYSGRGWGGQRVDIFPGLEMVVVMTGGNYVLEDPGNEIVEKYILPAVVQPVRED